MLDIADNSVNNKIDQLKGHSDYLFSSTTYSSCPSHRTRLK